MAPKSTGRARNNSEFSEALIGISDAQSVDVVERVAMLALLVVFGTMSGHARAQEAEEEPEPGGFSALPAVFYTPETGFGGGGFLAFETPTLRTTVFAAYTQLKQVLTKVRLNVEPSEDLRLNFLLEGEHYPTRMYGLGRGADRQYGAFTEQRIDLRGAVEKRLGWLRVAMPLRTIAYRSEIEDGSLYAGVGLRLGVDTRDDINVPTRGSFHTATLLPMVRLDSKQTFISGSVDLRRYVGIGKLGVIAGQLRFDGVSDDAPMQELPMLGGSFRIRGMFEGRYRDQFAAVAQLEYRTPMFWRFSATIFSSVGTVGGRYSEGTTIRPVWSHGLGLRLLLNKDTGLRARVDASYTDGGIGFVGQIGEAF